MGSLGNRDVFARNLQYYMDFAGKTRTQVCDDLGIKYTTFADWIKGKFYPRIDKIELLANYFGIQKSDLIEDKEHERAKDVLDFSRILGRIGVKAFLCQDNNEKEVTGPFGFVITKDNVEFRYMPPRDSEDLFRSVLSFLKYQIDDRFDTWKKTDKPTGNVVAITDLQPGEYRVPGKRS